MKWLLLFLTACPLFSQVALSPVNREPPQFRFSGYVEPSFVFSADSNNHPARSKKEFMQLYGKNDTSRALIRYYFFRGKNYRRFI